MEIIPQNSAERNGDIRMKAFLKTDLHMHSTVSDGTDSPEKVLRTVREHGIEVFSLTDHDAVKGCAGILSVISSSDPAFVTGAEFSCRDDLGQYHILGYGYDPSSPPILELVETGHAHRMNKVRMRLDFIKREYGFEFSEEDVRGLLALDNPGKPHIGNLMVRYGYAPSKETAIRKYLDKASVREEYVRPEEAIRSILDSGGVPVLAHPAYGNGDQLIIGNELDRRIGRLAGLGLEGVEAFYSGFTPKLSREALSAAERYGLYVTAGSDYHGRNKNIRPGDTGLTAEDGMPRALVRFLERMGL